MIEARERDLVNAEPEVTARMCNNLTIYQLEKFTLTLPGIEPRPPTWEASVLPACIAPCIEYKLWCDMYDRKCMLV